MGKKLGILGGMGPLATVKLFEMIVLLTKANSDQEHIPILIDNNTSIPDRTNYLLNGTGEDPRVQLIKSAKGLEELGADFLIMPCNTAHAFYEDIVKEIDIPFINMIEETAKYIRDKFPDAKKVGLLATEGTIKARVYHKVFENYGIEILSPSKEKQTHVTDLIYNIKKDIKIESLDDFYSTMDELRSHGAHVFIAGCTEISVAIDLYKLEGEIVDAMKALAIRAIKYAGKEPKED